MNNKTEILAPVGSFDALTAAVRTGADAVYLGLGNFNARRNADNFDSDTLRQAVSYCHLKNVKVYVTLNTLVGDSELLDAFSVIKSVCASGADAFIVQDFGIAKLIRTVSPTMPIHASTQMAISTPAGFNKLQEYGFTRAVLPRELSLSEIREIRNTTDMELEMFVHGALCMCVSGQCYLSAVLGGRSGNRGLCAQPCRLPFAAAGGTGYDLSLKDLSLIDRLPELREIGIDSFKIEGRMKRPEYVAAAVAACKNALSGCKDEELYSSLKAVFSRSGFTTGYYDRKLGCEMFGTRGKDDVVAANSVLKPLQKLYEKETLEIPISMSFTAEIGKPVLVSASTGKVIAFATSDVKVQTAKNHATEVKTIRTQLKKTGGTIFSVKMTDIKVDENINIPVSEINDTRRKVLTELERKLRDNNCPPVPCADTYPEFDEDTGDMPALSSNTRVPAIYIRLSDVSQLPPADTLSRCGVKKIILPLATTQDKFSLLKRTGIPYGVEIPRGLYGSTSKLSKQLKELKKFGISFVYAPSFDALTLCSHTELPILGGFTLNAFNSLAASELCNTFGISELTLSPELKLGEIDKLKSPARVGICSYGHLPLMLTRNCPIRNGKDCKSCKGGSHLTDRKGVHFPVVCTNGMSEVLNSLPLYLADKQTDLSGLDFQLLYFTKENEKKVASILECYHDGSEPKLEFTRGLYYRGVQ